MKKNLIEIIINIYTYLKFSFFALI